MKTCAACRYWAGTTASYTARCAAPDGLGATTFDTPACTSYAAPGPATPAIPAPEPAPSPRLLNILTTVRNSRMQPILYPPASAFPLRPQHGDLHRPAGQTATYKARLLHSSGGGVMVDWIEQ